MAFRTSERREYSRGCSRIGHSRYHCNILLSPSISMVCPVMKSASGEAKKKTVRKSQMTNKLALGFAAQGDRVIAADLDEAAA